LAIIIAQRKKQVFLVFLGFIALAALLIFIIPKQYTYSTSIEIGSQFTDGKLNTFESPETLLAKLQHSFIPQVISEYKKNEPGNKRKYKINASIPENSNIIVIELKGTEEQSKESTTLLKNITKKATQDHSRIHDSIKSSLEAQLVITNSKIVNLGSGNDNQAEKTSLHKSLENYSRQLANLRNTREITPPMKSVEATSISSAVILSATIFVGFLLAILSAFFAEFVVKVREKCLEQ